MKCGKQFDSMREVQQCTEKDCPFRPTGVAEPDLAAFHDWREAIRSPDEPYGMEELIRAAFQAGWRAGNDYAFEGITE